MPKASQVAPEPLVDSTESCRFYMIKAVFIRAYSGLKLPFFQEIRSKHPEAIVEVTITFAEVVSGTHAEKILSVSHRWMTAQDPDPDGEQLKAIKTFLESDKGRVIELVWIDAASMPQDQPKGSRSAPDTADFIQDDALSGAPASQTQKRSVPQIKDAHVSSSLFRLAQTAIVA